MRKITLLSLLLCILCTIQAKERVIDRPPFLTWSSSSIEIDKMVINDTATIVHIKAYYRPKLWIKVAKGSFLKDNNGQLYPIRNGIGITLDQEFWMPESGEAEFQLVFPPIPQTATSLDFSEGDFDGAYKIWGIQLDTKAAAKQKAPKEAITYKIDKNAELQQPIIRYGKGTLKGKILNYREDLLNSISLYIIDPIRNTKESGPISVNKDGTFQFTANVISPTHVMLRLPFTNVRCLIAPDEETMIYINPWECTRRHSELHKDSKPYGLPIYFSGYMARQQQEISSSGLGNDIDNLSPLLDEIYEKSPEEAKAVLLKDRESKLARIEQAPLSKDTKEILKIRTTLIATQHISNIYNLISRAYAEKHKPTREQMQEYYKSAKMAIPTDFYDTLKDFAVINTPKALYAQEYTQSLYAVASKQDILKELWGTDQGTIFNMSKARQLGRDVEEFTPLTPLQKEQLSFLPLVYRELINKMNSDLLEKMELNKRKTGFTINEAGEVANEDLFSSIIAQFRGHTLLVDFWATWCGPCRMANKEMIPMKEVLKDKDIIYIYITGESSPQGTWENMIPDIHGEHFRVTSNQWSYLMSNFNIEGVPTYFVIDREGNITFKQTGFPGVNAIKEQLTKVLEK